ncbi:DUF1203 domain-containing protein [Ahrensia marina]|uniref:DUF1203 domain-containing protein n=1 Tax=Ahrensia marina TaxID=1514904 RepID=A0A0M9GKX9_9HYPH|nr:DUF1203 domain-containing protein [Ahrensia marina]KPB00180.1 hypothetical protein SU32_15360 [Ahrensia marina]
MNFQFHALDHQEFAHLLAFDDETLAQHNARRIQVRDFPSAPCRVSLEDAEVGETVILANYLHMPKDSPYRSSHAVYVREGVTTAKPEENEIPKFLNHRFLSVRAFDAQGMMLIADTAEGSDVKKTIMAFLADPKVENLHIHFAKQGCYAARVTRL